MSDTQPNAYRSEAAAKRNQSILLSNEADELETKADELEGKTAPVSPPAEQPAAVLTNDTIAVGSTEETAKDTSGKTEEKPSRVPFRK